MSTMGIFGSRQGLGADYPWNTPSPETYALQRQANDWLRVNGYQVIELTGVPDQKACGAIRKAGLFVPKTCSGFIEPVPSVTRPPALRDAPRAPVRPPALRDAPLAPVLTRPPALRDAPVRAATTTTAAASIAPATLVAAVPSPESAAPPRVSRGLVVVGIGAAIALVGYALLHRTKES